MYFTDAGIEELDDRRGDEQVSMSWLAERLRDFVDLNPEFETAVDRLASWLARLEMPTPSRTTAAPQSRNKGTTLIQNGLVAPPRRFANAIHLDFPGLRHIVWGRQW